MAYEFIVALENQQTLLTLVVEAWSSLESVGAAIIDTWRRFHWRLVLVNLSGLLSGILEPNYNYSRAEIQQFGQVFQIIIFRIGIVLKEFLQYFYLVVGEARAVGPLPGRAARRSVAIAAGTRGRNVSEAVRGVAGVRAARTRAPGRRHQRQNARRRGQLARGREVRRSQLGRQHVTDARAGVAADGVAAGDAGDGAHRAVARYDGVGPQLRRYDGGQREVPRRVTAQARRWRRAGFTGR